MNAHFVMEIKNFAYLSFLVVVVVWREVNDVNYYFSRINESSARILCLSVDGVKILSANR
jgi:hypothetical protein